MNVYTLEFEIPPHSLDATKDMAWNEVDFLSNPGGDWNPGNARKSVRLKFTNHTLTL